MSDLHSSNQTGRTAAERGSMTAEQEKELHWLVRPSTIKRLWWVFSGILALTVIAQFFVPIHEYFVVDGWFAFYAIFGFVSCVLMVIVAKLLGYVLKRPDTYYDDE